MDERKAPGAGTRLPRSLFAWLTLGGAFACGPSITTVHEGTVRFEHCNRLDLDQHVAKQECRQCWSSWLSEYTYGQPRDRIDYARRRTRALANGEARPMLALDQQAPDERQFYLVVPGPTSVRTPPPPVATVWKNGDGDAGSLAKTTDETPPAESCADQCRTTWKTCGVACGNGHAEGLKPPNGSGVRKSNGSTNGGIPTTNGGAPATNGCSSKCGGDYSSCMKRCFE
jgi:hypothetical protein